MTDLPLFPCTLVGSYPQPNWLIDRESLAKRFPPRTRAKELWRIPPELLEEAQRDATRLAIESKQPVVIDDAQTSPLTRSIHELMRERGTHSLLIVPLLARGEAIGTIGMPGLSPETCL